MSFSATLHLDGSEPEIAFGANEGRAFVDINTDGQELTVLGDAEGFDRIASAFTRAAQAHREARNKEFRERCEAVRNNVVAP